MVRALVASGIFAACLVPIGCGGLLTDVRSEDVTVCVAGEYCPDVEAPTRLDLVIPHNGTSEGQDWAWGECLNSGGMPIYDNGLHLVCEGVDY